MTEQNPLLNLAAWKLPDPDFLSEHVDRLRARTARANRPLARWTSQGRIAPHDFYCYLMARFGKPNGYMMMVESDSKNWIQWHYALQSDTTWIDIFGMDIHTEILALGSNLSAAEDERLSNAIKSDFSNFGSKMSEIRNSLERWTVFLNPYVRLHEMVSTFGEELQEIDLSDRPRPIDHITTRIKLEEYRQRREEYHARLGRAAGLGTALRMVIPVFAESFVNLAIFLLAKQEIRSNVRLFESMLRENIDLRVGKMHLLCAGFKHPVPVDDPDIKAFFTIMNSRNDFLHGNIRPSQLKVDEMFFDGKTALFLRDGARYDILEIGCLTGVEPTAVLKDVESVSGFICAVLNCLDDQHKAALEGLMRCSFPGWRDQTKRLGVLFYDEILSAAFIRDDQPSL
jgi:hypothetical protein